jgi:hypothetical protein
MKPTRPYKRSVTLLSEEEIARAMFFTCSCLKPCAIKWTREGLYNARKHYLERSLQAQLIFVYDILMACYNIELKTVRLTILGTNLPF